MKQALLILLFTLFAYGTHAQLCRPIASSRYTYENGIGTLTDSYEYAYAGNRGAFNIPTGNITYDTCNHLIGIVGQDPAYLEQDIRSYNASDTCYFTQHNVWDPLYIWLPAHRGYSVFDTSKRLTNSISEGYWPWTDWFREDSVVYFYSGDILDSIASKKWIYSGTQQIATYSNSYVYDSLKRQVRVTLYKIDSGTITPYICYINIYGLNVDTNISRNYSINTNSWYNNNMGVLTRDTSGNIINSQQYHWNYISQQWDSYNLGIFVYNGYNQVTSDTSYNTSNGVAFMIHEYQYTGNLIINKLTKLYDPSKQQMVNQTHISYTYTAHQLPENTYYRIWDTATSAWVNQSYTGNIYNANDQATSFTEFVGDSVLGWKRSKATYYFYEQFPASISSSKKSIKTLYLYPNPVSDVLYCKFTTEGNYALSIYDMAGRIVSKLNGNNTAGFINVPVQYLSKGFYQLCIDARSEQYIGKFIKE